MTKCIHGQPLDVACPSCKKNLQDGGGYGVACAICGGNVFMLTCNMATSSGHDWVLSGICITCRSVHWTDGCSDCRADD